MPVHTSQRASQRARAHAMTRRSQTVRPPPRRIDSFPPELLSEIFLFLCAELESDRKKSRLTFDDGKYETLMYLRPNLDRQPWTLTHICQSWRRTALTTPKLWSILTLSFGRPTIGITESVNAYRRHCRIVSTWLTLSKNSPLFVTLWLGDDLKELAPGLLESISRWQTLLIFNHQDHTARVLDYLVNNPLPSQARNLQEMDMDGGISDQYPFPLSKFPNLKELTGSTKIILPGPGVFHRLEVFSGRCEAEQCFELMALLPLLKKISVLIESPCDDSLSYSKQVTSQVKDLHIVGDTGAICCMLDSVAFPAVFEADFEIVESVDDIENKSEFMEESLDTFFGESASTLTDLKLVVDFKDIAGFFSPICYAQSITRLSVTIHHLSDENLRLMEWKDSSETNFWPNLAYMEIRVRSSKLKIFPYPRDAPASEPYWISAAQLVKTVRSRWLKNRTKVILKLNTEKALEVLKSIDEILYLRRRGALEWDWL